MVKSAFESDSEVGMRWVSEIPPILPLLRRVVVRTIRAANPTVDFSIFIIVELFGIVILNLLVLLLLQFKLILIRCPEVSLSWDLPTTRICDVFIIPS